MFNAVKNYILPSKVEEGTDKPTVIVDPPKVPEGAKGGTPKKSDLNAEPDIFHPQTRLKLSEIVAHMTRYMKTRLIQNFVSTTKMRQPPETRLRKP